MKCKRFLGFLWRKHCFHYACDDKAEIRNGIKVAHDWYECCVCGKIRDRDSVLL